jgi:hypothetical protein
MTQFLSHNLLPLLPISELQSNSLPYPEPTSQNKVVFSWVQHRIILLKHIQKTQVELTESISEPAQRNCSAFLSAVADASVTKTFWRIVLDCRSHSVASWVKVMELPFTYTQLGVSED